MLLLRIGEEGHSKISVRAGSMFWIIMKRYGILSFVGSVWLTSVLQVDGDRAVAAGASWGGYAIK